MPSSQIPNLNYATEYQQALEQAFPYALYFGKLYSTPNNGRFKWVNSKTIEIPSISTTGRTNADRDSISTAQRNYNNAWETKTLVNERKWSTLVHPKDIDQTNMAASIANITQVFNEEHKFPEMDAYTISKIYYDWSHSVAGDAAHEAYVGHTPNTTELTINNVLSVFDSMMLEMDNKRVPVTGRILYVTNEVKTLIKNAANLQRNWDVQSGDDVINRVVNRLDEVEVIGIPAELMKTLYDFSDVNGWAPDPLAKQINMCLILPTAVITPVSYTFSKLDAPSAITEGKYYYYEESFEDVFILNKKADAIQFNVSTPVTAGLTVNSVAGTTSGKTKITVTPAKGKDNSYKYATGATVDVPEVGADCSAMTTWDGTSDITATSGNKIVIVEVNSDGLALKSGVAVVASRS